MENYDTSTHGQLQNQQTDKQGKEKTKETPRTH